MESRLQRAVRPGGPDPVESKMIEEGYLDHWKRASQKFSADPVCAFARRIVEIDKVVLTDRLNVARWVWTVIRSGDPKMQTDLKLVSSGDILGSGGVGFGSALSAGNCVDKLNLLTIRPRWGRGAAC